MHRGAAVDLRLNYAGRPLPPQIRDAILALDAASAGRELPPDPPMVGPRRIHLPITEGAVLGILAVLLLLLIALLAGAPSRHAASPRRAPPPASWPEIPILVAPDLDHA